MSPLRDLASDLAAIADATATPDAPSAPLTTYRVGGPIGLLVEVATPAALTAVGAAVVAAAVPVAVVGRGSNLLVVDDGFDGVVLRLGPAFEDVAADGDDRVVAGGACPLPVLARQSVALGRRGLEFFVGIPGSVGGAVRMNAGGHGRETVEVLVDADVLRLGAAAPERRAVADLDLTFRRSGLRDDEVVVRARFVAPIGDPDAGRAEIDDVVRWRRANQPGGQNCGSVFVNPPGEHAGRLIEACGLKGRRVGGAEVSPKHANFIQAEPGASAADVLGLVEIVRAEVAARFGVTMRTELRVLGGPGPGPNPPIDGPEVRA